MRLCSSCFVSLMYKSGHSSLHWTVYTILLCVLVLDPLGVIVCWKVWNIWGHCVCWKSSGGFQILQSYYIVQNDDDVVVFVSLSSSAHFSGVSKLLVCVYLLFITLDSDYFGQGIMFWWQQPYFQRYDGDLQQSPQVSDWRSQRTEEIEREEMHQGIHIMKIHQGWSIRLRRGTNLKWWK